MVWAWRWWWSSRWRKWVTLAVMVLVALPAASIELTSQSWFCNSCHIMNSYYRSWQAGKHKHVDCVECHIAPGATNYAMAKLNGLGQVVDDLLSRTASKPSASVSDFSCMRSGCHDVAKVRASVRREGKYFFDHGKHLEMEYLGIDVRCTTCHSHVKGTEHFEVNASVCVTCHLITPGAASRAVELASMGSRPASDPAAERAGAATLPTVEEGEWKPRIGAEGLASAKTPPQQCKSCHDAPKKAVEYRGLKVVHEEYLSYGAACESCHRNVTAKPEKMDSGQCFSCHDFGMERLGSVGELHQQHSGGRHKVECFSCHGVIRHGPSAQFMEIAELDCVACHKKQHMVQQEAYKSATQLAHVPQDGSAVSPMYLVHVDCTGCHVEQRGLRSKVESPATVAGASPQACDRCHKAGLGETMVPLWQKNTHELYDSVAKVLPAAKAAARGAEPQRLVGEAERLLELVRLDGSWGVHNPRYTQKLLEEAKGKLEEAREGEQKKKGGSP